MDSLKVWSRALTAAAVVFNCAAGRGYNPGAPFSVTGSPADVPCSQMSPAYGVTALTNGEAVAFSAKCDLKGVGISGWRIYTNAADLIEKVLMLSGSGSSGNLTYPDDVQVYVDGVSRFREITAAEMATYRASATAITFANATMTLGGRGSTDNLVGQMDEVMVAECPEGAADALVAEIHGEGLLAVKCEFSSDGVTVEVPEGSPADQVFPLVGTTFGYAAGEIVPIVAEGELFDSWLCTLSTNGSNSAEWKTWCRLPAAPGEFQHPGVPVKVSWRKKTCLVLTVR